MAKSTIAKTKSGAGASVASAAKEISRSNRPDDALVVHLQRQIANAFVLYSNYKRYHWQTYGALFRDLHLLFDELATAVLATIDDLAERVRMIGQDPIAGPMETIDNATVEVATLGLSMREMIEQADRNAVRVIRELREAVRVADDEEDPGSADLLTRVVQIHEKHEWFLRDVLEKRADGFTS